MDIEGQELNKRIAQHNAEIARLTQDAATLETKHTDAVQDYATKKEALKKVIADNPA